MPVGQGWFAARRARVGHPWRAACYACADFGLVMAGAVTLPIM
jgi:hypothetical protein